LHSASRLDIYTSKKQAIVAGKINLISKIPCKGTIIEGENSVSSQQACFTLKVPEKSPNSGNK